MPEPSLSLDVQNYLSNTLDVGGLYSPRLPVVELSVSTHSFVHDSRSGLMPNLKGFRRDAHFDSCSDTHWYVSTDAGPNIFEVNLTLIDYWLAKGSIGIESMNMESEISILENYSKAQKQIMGSALKIMDASTVRFFNSEAVSLECLKTIGTNIYTALGKTSYFTSSLTNDLFAKKLESTSATADSHSLISAYPAQRNSNGYWILTDYEACEGVSNHVGGALIAVTSDRIPVIQRQDPNSQNHAGNVHVSGAGSFELSDLDYVRRRSSSASFDDFVKFGMARELFEETGLVSEDSVDDRGLDNIYKFSQSNIVLVTISRDVTRGGLPTVLGFAKLNSSFAHLLSLTSSETDLFTEFSRKVSNGLELRKYLGDLIARNENYSSQLALFFELLEHRKVQQQFNTLLVHPN